MADNKEILECSHCGLECPDETISIDDKYFCCSGCKTVYELLNENDLGAFYKMDRDPASFKKGIENIGNKYEFLENEELQEKLLAFKIAKTSKIIIRLPDIHCSACIYLLENLPKLRNGVIESIVNFVKKEASITFNHETVSLREVAELLESIGYPPNFDLSDSKGKKSNNPNRSLYFKLGAAGFSFGNIMMFSFPEYLSGSSLDLETKVFLTWVSLILSPLVLYAGSSYFRSAWAGLKIKHINIDVPISIGMIVLFVRSAYEIISGTGFGFMDSLSGLVFFLLLGKVFQQKTYDRLSFDRDYSSYFPLSVLRKGDPDKYIPLTELKLGDRLEIRNNEIIPCDSILFSSEALIDYSFVTGESEPVRISKGDKIFAGGRLNGSIVLVDTIKDFDKSYLTQLWNQEAFKKDEKEAISKISDTVAKYFTIAILIISIATIIYWYNTDPSIWLNAFTAVLIIACPCALALTIPFTYGTSIRVLADKGFYLKNDKILEVFGRINSIVFDKTGTLTDSSKSKIEFVGDNLNEENQRLIKSIVRHSTHPLSKLVNESIKLAYYEVDKIKEIPGKGIEASVNGKSLRIGSSTWIKGENKLNETSVFVEIDSKLLGYYQLKQSYRNEIFNLLSYLKKDNQISIVSGDTDAEKTRIEQEVSGLDLKFNQLPEDKLKYIESLEENKNVMMVGDGLNDAGALKAASFGVAVAENTSSFTPGSDAIILGSQLNKLSKFKDFASSSRSTVYISFIISFLYNIVGLYYATTGQLAPVTAAILMPLSSITVVLFTVITTRFKARKIS